MATKLKVGARLGIGFGTVLVLMAGLALMRLNAVSRSQDTIHKIAEDNVYKMNLVRDISESIHIVSRIMRNVMLLKDDAAIRTELKKVDDVHGKYDAAVAALEKSGVKSAEDAQIAKAGLATLDV